MEYTDEINGYLVDEMNGTDIEDNQFYKLRGNQIVLDNPTEPVPFKMRTGFPGDCIQETYEALQPILQKYLAMKKRHMSRDRIIGLMDEAFGKAIRR